VLEHGDEQDWVGRDDKNDISENTEAKAALKAESAALKSATASPSRTFMTRH
jgi:hypothetical protein